MRKGFVLIVFWQAMLSVSPVFADKVPELYQAAVGVIDQQSGSRANAIQKAFKQVLIRASGTTVIQSALLKPAQEYVEQYRYQVNPSLPEEKQLWVKFDALMVKQYLQDNGLQQWSDLRPSTLIWLAVDEDGQRSLVNQGLYTDVLVQSGTERGLPFLFPIMDLEDQTKVLFADVWGDFEETVKQGSVRYDADAVVVVRAQK
ncbi:MAG: DUF2066 domain-containing protein, partial [Methylococcales bacterium]|nr:DUF2066 domain-containing protein [Methylococcales bacterium]